MFERRHYKAIAETIVAIQSKALDSRKFTHTQVIETFVNLFEKDNPRFRRDWFVKYVAEAEEHYPCTNQYPLRNLPVYK